MSIFCTYYINFSQINKQQQQQKPFSGLFAQRQSKQTFHVDINFTCIDNEWDSKTLWSSAWIKELSCRTVWIFIDLISTNIIVVYDYIVRRRINRKTDVWLNGKKTYVACENDKETDGVKESNDIM